MARHPWVAAADHGIRWGVQLITPETPGSIHTLMNTGKRVEELGYDALFIFDHPAIHTDPWVALAGLAVATDRIRLGSTVNCANYRPPLHYARLGSDLDNLSDGRCIFGIGSGWWEQEFAALGVPFTSVPDRQAALDETLAIVTGAWGNQPFSFHGAHHSVDDVQILPPPVQNPRPPIMIGGSGERKTLRQVAEFGDACNVKEEESLSDDSISDQQRAAAVARKLAALDAHCVDLNRPTDEVLRTHFTLYLILAPTEQAAKEKLAAFDPSKSTSPGTRRTGRTAILCGTPERAIGYYLAMRAVGIQYFIVQLDGSDLETIELLATEVAPALA